MAHWTPPPEISPWRRRGLKIPPDSFRAWVRLGTWEFGMGVLLYVVVGFGTQMIVSAPHSIVTVFDFTNCYAAPPVALPCERVVYRVGALNAVLNAWCGLLLLAVAAWLVWDLWSAAPADHRRLPEAARRLVRAGLAQAAYLAMDASGMGLRLRARWRHSGGGHVGADFSALRLTASQGADRSC